MIQGNATAAMTHTLKTRHEGQYRLVPKLDVWVSQIGFGTQRVGLEDAEHEQAMRHALEGGINLIDTAGHYGQGDAERLVGKVIADLHGAGSSRDQFVIISKAGIIDTPLMDALEQANALPSTLFELGPGLAYSLSPDFLSAQIKESLARMDLETIDCFMLHNPENILQHFARERRDLNEARREFATIIQEAFECLEAEVKAGHIASYGISSNSFAKPADAADVISLSQMLEIATSLKQDHHFAIIELPLNLLESEAVSHPNQPGGLDPLSFAQTKGLGVLSNRVLDANDGQIWLRLIDQAASDTDIPDVDMISAAIDGLNDLEEALIYKLLPTLRLVETDLRRLKQQLASAVALDQLWQSFQSSVHWEENRRYFESQSQQGLDTLRAARQWDEASAAKIEAYADGLRAVFDDLSAYFAAHSRQALEVIRQNIFALRPDWDKNLPTTRLALRALCEEPGLSSVLLGMRKTSYVAEALSEFRAPDANITGDQISLLRQMDAPLNQQVCL